MKSLALLASGIGLALVAGAALSLSAPGRAKVQAAATNSPVLLELFTSQGCSSCPPADRLAARLASRDDVVIVSRPVTYWDRLGWKDTLALPASTDLQRAYASRGLIGRNGVYTPQIVANGARGTVGSREAAIDAMIADEADGTAALAVRPQGDGRVVVGIGGRSERRATLSLLALDREASVRIGRGENGGRTVSYTNVLKDERAIAVWSGTRGALVIPATRFAVNGADRYALVLREAENGRVLASRYVS